MSLAAWIRDGIAQPRVAIYLKVLAVFGLLGALSHLASILSINGTSWAARPLHFRVADLVLLPVNLALAWGLWRTRLWAVVGWAAAVLFLQFVPILAFSEFLATNARQRTAVYGMLVTDAALLGVLIVLLLRRKRS